MTSTNVFSGMGNNRSSSRVLRPPGGEYHDILGLSNAAEISKTPGHKSRESDEVVKEKVNTETKTEKVATVKSENQRRVRVPPGGFSSGLW
ncbi:jupiter microtubule associated homolog 1-like [Tribolium madens]|uniref:jupiter microtubule associated homolog 1-like n=1 Tax=Tribolium madens TaxID=41895 RepID=UPI001CF71E1E|nr:jupiter microtubule associated homolog 1-like [Tribolium madens]